MHGARPPSFTLFNIMYKVVVYAPAKRADTLPLFHLFPICILLSRSVVPSTGKGRDCECRKGVEEIDQGHYQDQEQELK